jgi:sugar phosphate isomerase/epimerase
MKIGYRTPGLQELDFRRKFGLARELELTAVEVAAREFEAEEPAAVRALADEMGITISAVAGGMNLCKPDLMAEAVSTCEEALSVCKGLGVGVLFSRTMWPDPGVPQADTWDHLIPAWRRMAEMAADAGVKFAIEADPPCFVHNLERVERLLGSVDHDNFYVNFDPTNYYIAGSDPLLVIEWLGDLIVNGHIKDGVYQTDRKEETPIGEGEVPYADIFRALMDAGIDIAMNIEHCSSVECVRSAAKFVHGVLAEL